MAAPGSALLPFGRYGGRPFAEALSAWDRTSAVRSADGRTIFTVGLTDPATQLVVAWEATFDADLPAVEWLVTFRNEGATEAPILEDVRALDLGVATEWHELVVYHATGGIAAPDAFESQQTILPRALMNRAPGASCKGGQTEFRLASAGGRSSNGVLPYCNVGANWDGYRGLVVGIGWSGQWEARISASAPDRYSLTS